MKILAIETSCDETAVALVEAKGELKNPRFKILENLVASQIKIHRPFGGVVPNLAKREHLKNLPILFKKLVASGYWLSPDLIAVTVGPGLEPALWTGINFAKELYSKLKTHNSKLKLVGVSHLEGHLYSFLLSHTKEALPYREARKESQWKESQWSNIFPAIHLLVSGGHTILILMKDLIHYKKLGETRDDAVGEAFDKVARLLDLPYPGGPEIEKFAKKGNSEAINFPRPMMNQKNYDFSFSGLKTAVLYYLKNNENLPLRKVSRSPSGYGSSEARERGRESSGRASGWASETPSFREASLSDVAASFQQAAFDVLISKTLRAAKEFKAKSIMISGGVAANKTLKKEFQKAIKFQFSNSKIPQLLITEFPTDNAAMIAVAGHINYLRKKNRRLIANGNLGL
ncbi:MAG: tRNA (adenosine(37)-N6)-threonylcarbamoyltransferase complex transferase subunit TsaD [Patescibacteria group bacterium]